MQLIQQRLSSLAKSSYSVLLQEDGTQLCFIVEDVPREVKIAGETRIPRGLYEIKFRKILSPKTKRYLELYPDWFTWHLELQDVPNFKYCYLHQGNTHEDTHGCGLLNMGIHAVPDQYIGSTSAPAFKKVYAIISAALLAGEQVLIDIRDESYLTLPF
jgi:hypothetical protein